MIVDCSKIRDLKKFQEKYNKLQMKLRKITAENLKLQGDKKRCDIYDTRRAKNFIHCQEQGFDPNALIKKIEVHESTIEGLKKEKTLYLLMLAEIKKKIEYVDIEKTEMEMDKLRIAVLEKDLMEEFLRSEGIYDEFQLFKRKLEKDSAELLPKAENSKRKMNGVFRRLKLYQKLDTVAEEDHKAEEDEEEFYE